jgi:hypothetical protein
MFWKNLNVNLNVQYMKKSFYNKKKHKLITINSSGSFYLWKISLYLICKKKFSFFLDKNQRITFVTKSGIGKIVYSDLYGDINIIDIIFMKKLLVIKTRKLISILSYTPKSLIGLSNKGDLCIFLGKRLQKFSIFSIDKNPIIFIFRKNNLVLLCAHENQNFSEFNIKKCKFEKKIKLNTFFISKISNIRIYQQKTIILLKNQEIFFF